MSNEGYWADAVRRVYIPKALHGSPPDPLVGPQAQPALWDVVTLWQGDSPFKTMNASTHWVEPMGRNPVRDCG